MAPDNIPKQELLAKLLKMTTSDTDAEALVAIRKANALLKTSGWDWDKLLAGKIKIIADPFATIQTPTGRDGGSYQPTVPKQPGYTTPRPNYTPQRPPTPQPKPQPAPARKPTSARVLIASTRTNRFAGVCYCCGNDVAVNHGWIFKATNHVDQIGNPAGKYEIACDECNNKTVIINQTRAPRTHRAAPPPHKTSTNDLA